MKTGSPDVPASHVWLSVLALVLVFCLVGRIDYEDALAIERGEGRAHWELLCRPSAVDAKADARQMRFGDVYASVDFQPIDARDDEPRSVLRCTVLNH